MAKPIVKVNDNIKDKQFGKKKLPNGCYIYLDYQLPTVTVNNNDTNSQQA